MEYYYAIWIPTKRDGIPTIQNEPLKKNFQDGWRWGGYFVNGKIDKSTLNFTLIYQPHFFRFPYQKKKSVTLTCKEQNKRGFLIYSLDSAQLNDDAFCKALEGKMNPAVYHYIKSCFHLHEFHESTTDALLRPFVADYPISLRTHEKDIVLFFLEQYKDKFEDFLQYSIPEYTIAKQNINGLFHVNEGINTIAAIIKKGNDIKGEELYYEYIRSHASSQTWISKDFKQQVKIACLNIQELLADATNAYNICTAGLGVKYGRWGIAFGIFGVFVSAFGIFYSMFDEPNLTPVHQHIDSVFTSKENQIEKAINKAKKEITDSIKLQEKMIEKSER